MQVTVAITGLIICSFNPKKLPHRVNLPIVTVVTDFQKHPFTYVLQNRCSLKFCNIHRKTPVLESLVNKGTGTPT